MTLIRLTALALFLAGGSVAAATPGPDSAARPPEREVRAVWFATAAALDWPASRDTGEQKASLRDAVEKLHRSGFNTIFFQVRGRGDACYRSDIEPWSEVLTGTAGADPGWDPLGLLIGEAHARGMEVHAWFNAYFVKGGAGPAVRTEPPHVMTAHPSWVKFHEDRWWLDPGEPAVGEYLGKVIIDIVTRYDLDGLQLDYLRYPGRGFDDSSTYARYGNGAPRDEWRRENVTRFLAGIRRDLARLRPLLKLGAAPIGIYRNPPGVRGLESFSDVYQDTYRWVALGLLDYVVPQLYWPIGGGKGDPDFAVMAAEWRARVAGCQLYLGIGSYKEEVLAQTERLVAVARATGADGQAFFRYENISRILPLAPYRTPILPPAMAWKDSEPPDPPGSVTQSGDAGRRTVSWDTGGEGERGTRCAVYRMSEDASGGTLSERLVAVVGGGEGRFLDTTAGDGGSWYAVTRLDRSWNESPPVRALRAAAPAAGPVASKAPGGILRLGVPWADESSGLLFVPFQLGPGAGAGIDVTVEIGVPGEGVARRLLRTTAVPGQRVLGIDIRGIGREALYCTVTAGRDTAGRPVKVRP